jgi:serine/threonine protein kinase
MKRARHRHVVSLVEVFSSPQSMWLVLELVGGGDLRRRIANESRYSETKADIAQGWLDAHVGALPYSSMPQVPMLPSLH